jgi:hypothetical protein
MTSGLQKLDADPDARDVLEIADRCGLRPRIGASGPGYGARPTQVIVDSRKRGGLFGTFTIGTRGEVTCAHLVHGNHGDEVRFDGPDAVRMVIASWAAITGAA